MDHSNFKDNFLNEIRSLAQTNMYSDTEAFFDYCCELITEAGEVQDFNSCFFEGKAKNGKKIRIDGYSFDGFSKTMNLIICDYREEFDSRKLGVIQIRELVNQAIAFVENMVYLKDNIEESTLAYQYILYLERAKEVIDKYRVIILTTEETSKSKKSLKFKIEEEDVYYNVWGLERFADLLESHNTSDIITINLLEYSENGIPTLYASNVKGADYESYLGVIPGNVLANLYDSYGAKLLEGNVRSFLSYRGKVNRAIRGTLLREPHMFFAFNNGISATASNVETHNVDGQLYIKSLTDFQIVNGGQTTASIFNVKHVKKEADLVGVYVAMKLNVVADPEKSEELIPKIAETANTQNKVNKADFFANSPFHVRLEKISLNLTAPTVEGEQFGRKWFYERARGAYEAKLISFKTSKAKKDQFMLTHPKNQKITKTDLAKYYNSINYKPFHVSKGAQRNFQEFANEVDKMYRLNQSFVNKLFYRNLVCVCIMFKAIEKIVSQAYWYQNAFRANIVTYSLSLFFYNISKLKNKVFNFDTIWKYQEMPSVLVNEFEKITLIVFEEITKDTNYRTRNITEWCKKEECWIEMIRDVNYKISPMIYPLLEDSNYALVKEHDAVKEEKKVAKLNSQIEVVNLGEEFWRSVKTFSNSHKFLNYKEISILDVAATMTRRLPTESQSKILLEILEKAKLEGFRIDK